MSVTDDMITPSSDSFWEIDCYKRTVKRHEDGNRLCGDLLSLIQDRADIEKEYANKLRNWNSPEYGTTEGGWKGVLNEALSVAELHLQMRERLLDGVSQEIKQWRVNNYKKQMMGSCKETKDIEDQFKKVQKPWAKRYAKVMKARKDYHTACKLERSAAHQENNARGATDLSPDQSTNPFSVDAQTIKSLQKLKKMQDKAEKCRKDVENAKEKYEAALSDINSYNAKYMEDMTEVFNKCQDYEEKRLKFFKEMLFGIHKCMDLSVNRDFSQIYTQLYQTVEKADYNMDLKWWSQNHGVDMAMNWPSFEEYSPEMVQIHKKEGRKGGQVSGSEGGITLTAINRSETQSQPPVSQPASIAAPPTRSDSSCSIARSYDPDLNPFGDDGDDDVIDLIDSGDLNPFEEKVVESSSKCADGVPVRPPPPRRTRKRPSEYDQSLNPFGDDDDDQVSSQCNHRKTSDCKEKSPQTQSNNNTGSWLHGSHVAAAAVAVSSVPDSKPVSNGGAAMADNQNPFDGWDDEFDSGDDGGVPVRALYDYVGQEDDELSFSVGDVFVKVRDKDDQGWCAGRIDGRFGLYPDNYAEVIGS